MSPLPVLLVLLLSLSPALPSAAQPSPYNPYDVSAISLYGPTAKYAPALCPPSFTFANRARFLPVLARGKIGLLPSDLVVNGKSCTSPVPALVFVPIGATDHFPPQWHFEDSAYSNHPVNFTCGDYNFAIRYGYFNDVSTASTGGFLDANVVYFDFAVIPNTKPFGFCSYAARRIDHDRPLNHAPFPSRDTWNKFRAMRRVKRSNVDEVPLTDDIPTPAANPSPKATPESTPDAVVVTEPSPTPESTPHSVDIDELGP